MKKINLLLASLSLLAISGCVEQVSSTATVSTSSSSTISSTSAIISSSSTLVNLYEFELTVKSVSGERLNDVTINIYKGENKITSVVTNFIGNAKVNLEEGKYNVKLDNIPQGLYATDDYTFEGKGGKATFICISKVIEEDIPDDITYAQGSIMYDFTVNAIKDVDEEAQSYTLSELFETKKYVILNFWATWCGPCVYEFPEFNTAYRAFGDDIEIIAMSVEPTDTMSKINNFKADYELTFPMGRDTNHIWERFGVNAIPVTAIVNQYGVIEYVKLGSFAENELTDMLDLFING